MILCTFTQSSLTYLGFRRLIKQKQSSDLRPLNIPYSSFAIGHFIRARIAHIQILCSDFCCYLFDQLISYPLPTIWHSGSTVTWADTSNESLWSIICLQNVPVFKCPVINKSMQLSYRRNLSTCICKVISTYKLVQEFLRQIKHHENELCAKPKKLTCKGLSGN